MTVSLEIQDLHVSIGTSEILHGISLEVHEGEVIALIGRNGAGKTTTLRSILGLQTVESGSVTFAGEEITDRQTHEIVKKGIGYSPEESDIFELTTHDNIEMGTWERETGRSKDERIELAYEVFPVLEEYRDQIGTQSSGGERKMLSLARALAMDPDLYLLDEPFEGLAPRIIPDIQESIEEIHGLDGSSMLLAESNIHHLPEYVDRIYVIERGELIFGGDMEEARADQKIKEIIAQR